VYELNIRFYIRSYNLRQQRRTCRTASCVWRSLTVAAGGVIKLTAVQRRHAPICRPVLRNQMTPLIIDSRVVLFRNILTPGRNILTPGHSIRVRVRGSIYFGESKYFVTPANRSGVPVAGGRKKTGQHPVPEPFKFNQSINFIQTMSVGVAKLANGL